MLTSVLNRKSWKPIFTIKMEYLGSFLKCRMRKAWGWVKLGRPGLLPGEQSGWTDSSSFVGLRSHTLLNGRSWKHSGMFAFVPNRKSVLWNFSGSIEGVCHYTQQYRTWHIIYRCRYQTSRNSSKTYRMKQSSLEQIWSFNVILTGILMKTFCM